MWDRKGKARAAVSVSQMGTGKGRFQPDGVMASLRIDRAGSTGAHEEGCGEGQSWTGKPGAGTKR